jgi:hypothetical protein
VKHREVDGIYVSKVQLDTIIDSIGRAELAARQAMLLSQSAAKAFGAEESNLQSVKETMSNIAFAAELDATTGGSSGSRTR